MTRGAPTAANLLTIPETAVRLRVERHTVYRLINAGDLRAVDIAPSGKKSRMRVREDDLAAFIEGRTASSTRPSVEDALTATS